MVWTETESLPGGQFAGGGNAAVTWTTVQVTNIQRVPVLGREVEVYTDVHDLIPTVKKSESVGKMKMGP